MDQQVSSLCTVAISAAREAGTFIQQGMRRRSSLNIEQKGLHDYVSEIDRGAEEIIRDRIQSAFPGHEVIGEEFGQLDSFNSDYQWIVDPLDGTTNFVRGIPHYAVSIAILYKDKLEVGVVYDPAKNELFSAIKGQGAWLNDTPIRSSGLKGVRSALLATGVPFSGVLLENIDMFTDSMVSLLSKQTSGIRRLGAAALDLAYVATGRYDGFWEANLKSWDIAAGALIVMEAGGVVSDFNGGVDYLVSGDIVASASGVHRDMLSEISKAYCKS